MKKVKRDKLVIVGDVVLLLILAALFVLEIKNPQGGVELINGILGTM